MAGHAGSRGETETKSFRKPERKRLLVYEKIKFQPPGAERNRPEKRFAEGRRLHRSGKVNIPFAGPGLPAAPTGGDIRLKARPRSGARTGHPGYTGQERS